MAESGEAERGVKEELGWGLKSQLRFLLGRCVLSTSNTDF